MIVEIVAAYVDGRPMPCSSSALISVASVYRGGGSVKCWVGVDVLDRGRVAVAERRQRAAPRRPRRVVVAALGVDARENPSNSVRVARRPQLVRAVGQLDRRRLELLGLHLAGEARCQIRR